MFQVRFAYSRQLAGVMFWSLELDDFLGTSCNDGEFPLLTAVYDAIQELKPTSANNQVVTMTTTPKPSTTPVDFRLHHKTNKNGINFFVQKTENGATRSHGNHFVWMTVALFAVCLKSLFL